MWNGLIKNFLSKFGINSRMPDKSAAEKDQELEKALRMRRIERFVKDEGLSRRQAISVAQIVEVLRNERK